MAKKNPFNRYAYPTAWAAWEKKYGFTPNPSQVIPGQTRTSPGPGWSGVKEAAGQPAVTAVTNLTKEFGPQQKTTAAPGSTGPKPPGSLRKPGFGEEWWKQFGSKFTQPTRSGQYWGQVKGELSNPFEAEDYWSQNKGNFAKPWQGETTISNTLGDYDKKGAFEEYFTQDRADYIRSRAGNTGKQYQDMKTALSGQGWTGSNMAELRGMLKHNTQDFFGETRQDYLDPSFREEQYFSLAPTLPGKSYSEELYEEGNSGLNRFYDRNTDRGIEKVNREMAARGLFGSEAAGENIREVIADAIASQSRDMADLAGQGDQMRSLRLKDAMDLATGGDTGKLERLGAGTDAAATADSQERENMLAMLEAYGQAEGEFQGRQGMLMSGAEAADKGALDAEGMIADNWFRSQELGDKRRNDKVSAAKTLGDLTNQRYTTGGTLSNNANTQRLNRIGLGADIAQGADQTELDWFDTGFNNSVTAQNLFENRELLPLIHALSIARDKSGIVSEHTGAANDEMGGMIDDWIQSMIESGKLDVEQSDALRQQMYMMFGLGIQGAQAFAPRKYGPNRNMPPGYTEDPSGALVPTPGARPIYPDEY